jgi:predicted nucleotidyltransferase
MVKTDKELELIINRYILSVRKVFKIDSVYLFGSYALGSPHKDSDIDIAIVSEDFKYMNEFIAMKILARLREAVDLSISAIPVTPEDLGKSPVGTIEYTIAHRGEKIYSA